MGLAKGVFTQEEAETLAAERTKESEGPDGRARLAHWGEARRNRVVRDARHLATLLRSQFPELLPLLSPLYTDLPVSTDIKDPGLTVAIPSVNASIDTPLTITVLPREVLISWGVLGHTHINPHRPDDGENPEYLDRAVEWVRAVLQEEVVFLTAYWGEIGTSGILTSVQHEQPTSLTHPTDPRITRVMKHSWRGTYDQIVSERSSDVVE